MINYVNDDFKLFKHYSDILNSTKFRNDCDLRVVVDSKSFRGIWQLVTKSTRKRDNNLVFAKSSIRRNGWVCLDHRDFPVQQVGIVIQSGQYVPKRLYPEPSPLNRTFGWLPALVLT